MSLGRRGHLTREPGKGAISTIAERTPVLAGKLAGAEMKALQARLSGGDLAVIPMGGRAATGGGDLLCRESERSDRKSDVHVQSQWQAA